MYYTASLYTHKLLRVMEAVKKAEGNEAAQRFYWEAGAVIHHDRTSGAVDMEELLASDASAMLAAAGLDASYNDAFEDEAWDEVIRERMQAGLDLVGNDVGTPILAYDTEAGYKGIFGPVISKIPPAEKSVELWDAMVTMSTMDGFWELKRTRTEDPQFPERP